MTKEIIGFEELYTICDDGTIFIKIINMKFGEALDALESGQRVQRSGWNGKGMYLYHVPAQSYPAVTEIARNEFGSMVPYGAYIAMKTAQDNVVPWLASQTDILAKDWNTLP